MTSRFKNQFFSETNVGKKQHFVYNIEMPNISRFRTLILKLKTEMFLISNEMLRNAFNIADKILDFL